MKYFALSLPGMNGTSLPVPTGVPTGGLTTGLGKNIAQTGIVILFIIAIILALGYLIYGGFKWMTSGGDQDKLGGARQTITYAIIGICVVFLSFFVINILNTFIHPDRCLLCIFQGT